MVYTTKYLRGISVVDLATTMEVWFEEMERDLLSMKIDNIAYMQEMKVQRLNPQIPVVEFCCIITYSP